MPINDAMPEALHKITERPVQWPNLTGANTPGSGSVPVQTLPIIIKNNPALAPKPSTLPPHPQISQTLTGIPLGFQFAFKQLVSPTPYGNQIDSYRIYRNVLANNFSGALLIRTIKHDSTHLGAVTVQDSVTGGKQYYYFVTAVDTTGQESKIGAFQGSAVTSGNANPNVGNAAGTTVGPATNSASFSVLAEMTQTVTTKGNKVLVTFHGVFLETNGVCRVSIAVFRDGTQISDTVSQDLTGNALRFAVPITWIDSPSAGSHTYDIRWSTNANTATNDGTSRSLQVVELG